MKRHEYRGLTAAAREIRGAGCPAVLVAPFTTQIRDPTRWPAWVAELGGEPVRLVWVRSDAATLRSRLMARERGRDRRGKLADFDAFIERIEPHVPPPVPHIEIDNRDSAPRWSNSCGVARHTLGSTSEATRRSWSQSSRSSTCKYMRDAPSSPNRPTLRRLPRRCRRDRPAQLIGALADRGGASSYLLVVHSTASVWAAL